MNTRLIVSVVVFLAIVFEPVVPASGGAPGLAENAALQYWKAFAGVPELSHAQMDAVAKALEQGTIAPSLRQVIASSKSALHELRKGAAVKQCAWGISFDEGINAVLPHLSKARQLARVACLRAEVSFQQGKAQEATEDVAAVTTLGRHIAAEERQPVYGRPLFPRQGRAAKRQVPIGCKKAIAVCVAALGNHIVDRS